MPARTSSRADEQAVIDTVQAFFDVIASKDVAAGARLTIPDGVFVNIRTENGRQVVKHFRNAQWLIELPADAHTSREAFDGEPTVLVHGDVAMVWAPYVFDKDGKRSHTGVDVFNLLRTEEGWQIAGGAYSVVR